MKIILSDSTKTVEWPIVEVPLPETTVDNVKNAYCGTYLALPNQGGI